jgi:spoIIIJ-associated protein
VEDSGKPHHFAAMNSRERRMLHMFLAEEESGMKTASTGEGPRRHVVLYPEGYRIPEERRSFGNRGRGGFGNRGGNGGRGRGNREDRPRRTGGEGYDRL